jgi:manganese/zinc/iron transport system permease protein
MSSCRASSWPSCSPGGGGDAHAAGRSRRGVVAVILIELVKRAGQVEPGAAMGVVFTTLFAAGVLMLEQSDTSSVHLDVEHALMGNLESLIWLSAEGWGSLVDPAALAALPPELPRMALWRWLMVVLTAVFWRWLKIATFDEGLCRGAGHSRGGGRLRPRDRGGAGRGGRLRGRRFHHRDRDVHLPARHGAADDVEPRAAGAAGPSLVAAVSAILGYVLAGYGPLWLGAADSVSAAGMIATVSGALLGLACLFGPHRRRVGAAAFDA